MKIKYIWIMAAILGFTACENDDDTVTDEVVLPELISGNADFSNFVSLGASFTAGFADGGLFIASQENSFPNTLAKQFAKVGGGDFSQPLMSDNTGAILVGGTQATGYRLVFNGSGPARLNDFLTSQGFPVPPVTTEAGINIGSDFNNFGIPGAKSTDLIRPGYAAASPFYARIASSGPATVLADAVAKAPTFFTLSEIGGNDILGFATSGGDGSNPITDVAAFDDALDQMINGLTANNAKGAIGNLPNITSLPFFTTIPNDALDIDAGTAANLTGFFQAVAGITTQVLIQQGVPPAQAQALAAQYAITFNEGPNRFLIDVPASPTNPLGFRQMTEEELLLLTIDRGALANGYGSVVLTPDVAQVLVILQTGGNPTPEQAASVLAAVSGIDDKDALDTDELNSITTATMAYNSSIASKAALKGLALVDFNTIFENATTGSVVFDEFTLNTNLVTGGLVSLDGIHLTPRGYALMANSFLEAIDANYGSNFVASGNVAKAADFTTNFSPTLQ